MIKKYMRNCRRLFPVYGKYEKDFLNKLQKGVESYMQEFPDADYEELTEQFGSPKEVVTSYYRNVDNTCLLRKINLVKTVRIFCIGLIFLFICFWGYQTYIICQAYSDAKNTEIIPQGTVTIYENGSSNNHDIENQN